MMRHIGFITFLLLCACGVAEDKKEKQSEITILSEKIRNDPENTDLLLSRANYNKEKGNLESALFDLNQCLQLDSLNNTLHFSVAEIYFEISKETNADSKYPSLAMYHLERALKLNINDASSHALLGELLLAYAENETAIKHFNASLEVDYNQAKTHMLMGYAFKQLGKDNNAINCFRNAVNVDPTFKEAFVQLGQMFHMKRDTIALEYYDNALKIDSTDEMTLYNKALFYQSIMQWNAALEAYAELHKVNAFHSSGHYNIGFIHMELGLYDIATNNFADAIYGNSEFYEAYYSRGICFETLGNIAQAEVDYKRAIEINPDYAFAVDALKALDLRNKKFNK